VNDGTESREDIQTLIAGAMLAFRKPTCSSFDSPNGTSNHGNVLSQMLGLVRVQYVLDHNLRRDPVNVFRDQMRFGLRPIHLLEAPRGLTPFEIGASDASSPG
jgi:hypothetical protein